MDLLTTPAREWQTALQSRETTSCALVEACVQQMERLNRQNSCLNAIISVAPLDSLLMQAQQLDEERAFALRSPLHGIPIVIKDIFITDAALGMPTTCGAAALGSAVGHRNGALVERLLAAGLIIVGKANLTEFCGLRASAMRLGLSSLGGQTQSPYVIGGLDEADTPLGNTHAAGSSSGPAVSVSAGFAPIAVGSETSGSLIAPANRAGLYSLKVSNSKAVPLCAGMYRLSSYYDSVGALAKSATDLADITAILINTPTLRGPARPRNAAFEGFKVGFVDPDSWRYSDDMCYVAPSTRAQLRHEYEQAIRHVSGAGGQTVTSVQLPALSSLSHEGESIIHTIAFSEIAELMKEFFSSLDCSSIHNLDDLIAWNDAHPQASMPEPCPDQEDLIKAQKDADSLTRLERQHLFELGGQRAYEQGIDKAFREHNLDVLLGPADSALYCLAAAAGCPIGTMPLCMVEFENRGKSCKRPDGLCIIGRRDSDVKILEFLLAYERVFPFRPIPTECR